MQRLTALSAALMLASTALVFGQLPSSNGQSGFGPAPVLPPPAPETAVANWVTVTGWPAGKTPTAPEGFQVTAFGEGLEHPRWLYVLPNGDVLVAEAATLPRKEASAEDHVNEEGSRRAKATVPSANRITRLRDSDGDGTVDEQNVFLRDLNQPFGMLVVGSTFFVGNTDGLFAYPYDSEKKSIGAAGKKILSTPPGGYNNHWTRNVIANASGSKLYVSIGSASNAAEHGIAEEHRRANILEIDPDGSGERVFASGLRNPNGMDWEPVTGALWTVVNERDNLGDDLVPDYLTHVQDGGFYGWPFSYYGAHVDERVKPQNPDLVKKAIVPDYALGDHTASLGLTFYRGETFPARYKGGAFIGQHGSWNRSQFSGYKVLFVRFENGKPTGLPEDFLTGFQSGKEAYGRPVGVVVDRTGALLVADDAGNRVWRIAPTAAR